VLRIPEWLKLVEEEVLRVRTTTLCPFFNCTDGVKDLRVEIRVGGAWILGNFVCQRVRIFSWVEMLEADLGRTPTFMCWPISSALCCAAAMMRRAF
jgi:hypothetical protein